MEAPPHDPPQDLDNNRANETQRPKVPAERRALGRGLGSILSSPGHALPTPDDGELHESPREPDLETLLIHARDEIRRLAVLQQEIEGRLQAVEHPRDGPDRPAANGKTNGVLSELYLRGLSDFQQAVETATRLHGIFSLRSYEQGTLHLAVVPARALQPAELAALAAAAGTTRLERESHDSFVIQ